jgi:gliding motility-associated lipoprotein GldH
MSYFCSMNALSTTRILLILCCLQLTACNSIGVFEKNIAFKKQEWAGNYKPAFTFNITDTTAAYNIYLVLRHTDAYNYNNIWMKFTRKGPDTSYTQQVDLRLATNGQGWLGTGMDDIWEHRIPITQAATQFRKSGNYEFTLEQVMRQDPLLHVLNVGLRVEKIK